MKDTYRESYLAKMVVPVYVVKINKYLNVGSVEDTQRSRVVIVTPANVWDILTPKEKTCINKKCKDKHNEKGPRCEACAKAWKKTCEIAAKAYPSIE